MIACQWYERAAQQGFPGALENLANMMRSGRYPVQKITELRKLHKQAAATGDPDAQIALGLFIISPPQGVCETRNAIYWFKKAAAQGRYEACYHLGVALMDTPNPQDKETAVLWYQRGADHGDESCKAVMSWLIFTGQGVKQDAEKGLKIALEMAEQGHVHMMYMTARYYAGDGLPMPSPLPKDLAKAMIWYRKAAEKGHATARKMLDYHQAKAASTPEAEK